MSGPYTEIFGGNTIYPSDISYLALDLDADVTLQWPLEASTGSDLVARIIDVTPSGAYSILMPPADQTGVGQVTQFLNLGPSTIIVKDNDGGTIISVAAGLTWTIYLTDNSDAAGAWRSFQAGASTAQAQAAALAGFGLVAQGSVLSQSQTVATFNSDYTAGVGDRSSAYVWNGGVGTLTLTSASTLGNNWFMSLRNEGSGNLTVAPSGLDTINGDNTLVMRPGDSATINTDGTSFYTVGLGQDPVFAFDYTSIDLTAQTSPYTLSGSELNRIAYGFVGVLGSDMVVIVPSTTQQYWVANDTTGGSYTLSLGTVTQASPVTVNRGSQGIYYCQGTTVVNADTASISLPIAISDGGTGASSASGARINLGGSTVGIAVFTAANAATARVALAAAALGANSDITSLTGLTTPLAVNEGGTAQTTYTNGQLLIGNTSGNTLAKATLTQGSGVTITNGAGTITIAATGSGGTVTSVSGSGGSTGLTLTGGPITGTGTLTLGGTLAVGSGGTGAATLTGILKGNGASAFTAATAGTDYVAPGTATTFTARQSFTGALSNVAARFVNAVEGATRVASPATGTINYDVTSQDVLWYTSDASGDWTINVRGNGSNTLDSLMANDETLTVVFLATIGATPHYNSAIQIDATTSGVTTKWIGGAPAAGAANSLALYTMVIWKTATATYSVIASVASAT